VSIRIEGEQDECGDQGCFNRYFDKNQDYHVDDKCNNDGYEQCSQPIDQIHLSRIVTDHRKYRIDAKKKREKNEGFTKIGDHFCG
jgi:hypothetical protein